MFENSVEGTCVVKKTAIPSVIKEVVSELILPDYLPDVSRLLRTSADVGAENGYVSGGALEYDGEINHTVIYATSDGRIKRCRCRGFRRLAFRCRCRRIV